MPYNLSRNVVERFRRYLDDMAVAQRTITWPAKDSEVLARKLREAVAAAEHHGENFPEFAKLKVNYQICTRKGYVEARWMGPLSTSGGDIQETFAPTFMTIGEAQTAEAVVGAAIKFEPRADELHFPNARLTDKEKDLLYKWGKKSGWKLIDQEEAGITLTKKDVDELLLWTPEED